MGIRDGRDRSSTGGGKSSRRIGVSKGRWGWNGSYLEGPVVTRNADASDHRPFPRCEAMLFESRECDCRTRFRRARGGRGNLQLLLPYKNIEGSVARGVGLCLPQELQQVDEIGRRAQDRLAFLTLAEIQRAEQSGYRGELLHDGLLCVL